MGNEPLEPAHLVFKLRAWFRISVWQIEAADQDAVDGGFDVAAVTVVRIAGKPAARFVDLTHTAQNRDAIPALLAVPDCIVTEFADRLFRKLLLRRFEFLKTGD